MLENELRVTERDTVNVRLAALERAPEIEVGGTSSGTVRFVREPAAIRSSTGGLRPRFEVEPRAGAYLRVGEREYAGTLLVEMHPHGGLRVENRVALEDYVVGVVAAEIVLWSAFPAELEAQAVAARSYALATLAKRRSGAHLWDDTRDQVYKGRFVPDPGPAWAARARRLEDAVRATRGRVLATGGHIVDARFHASCGGATTELSHVFTRDAGADFGAARCEACLAQAARELGAQDAQSRVVWEYTATSEELAELARRAEVGVRVTTLRPSKADAAGRWLEVELTGDAGTARVPFELLREVLSPTRVRSAMIRRTWPHPGRTITEGLYLEGFGHGHGVGLCQVGSHHLAESGYSSRAILQHYYPGASLEPLDGTVLR